MSTHGDDTDRLASVDVELASRPYSEVQIRHVDWTIPGLIPSGMLSVVAGDPKLGKSLLLTAWAAQLSQAGQASALMTAEDSPEHTTKARLMAAQADETLIRDVCEHPMLGEDGRWLARIEVMIERHALRLMMIDPFTAFLAADSDSHKDQHVRSVLSPLRDIAERTQCAIVYVMHLNKTMGANVLHRIVGSGAFGQIARSVVLMTPQETRKEPGRIVAHVSCNVAELAPTQLWNIEKIILPELGGRPVHTARLAYAGVIEVDTDSLLAPRPDAADTSEREIAEQLIADALEFGAMPSADLEQLVRQAGISARTYDRARQKLGVRGRKDGARWLSEIAKEVSQSKDAIGKDAIGGWRSSLTSNDAGLAAKDDTTPITKESVVLGPDDVSQSPPDVATEWGDTEGYETGT